MTSDSSATSSGSDSENPALDSPTPKAHRPNTNQDWWPNQIDLSVLHVHSPLSNPLGAEPSSAIEVNGATYAPLEDDGNAMLAMYDALSAVDAQTEARILRALRGALEGRTSVTISHRLAAVRDADIILVLEGGRIVERGTHHDLIGSAGRYWELLRRQQLEEELEVG